MSISTEETETAKASQGHFHIVVDDSSDSVRWVGICVNSNKRIEEYLKEKGALDPFLLVVATQNDVEVARQIAPLERGMVHFAFPRAGTFKLQATIIFEENSDRRRLKRLINYRGSGGFYECDLIDIDGKLFVREFECYFGKDDRHLVKRHHHVAEETITVSNDNFARERAKWRVQLVGVFFKDNGKNECNWRKRWLGTLALLVVWLPLQYLIKTVGLILYGLGGFVYGLDMKLFPKPGRHGSVFDMFGGADKHTAWWFKRRSYMYDERNGYWIATTIFVPIWLLTSTGISADADVSFVMGMLYSLAAICALIAAFMLLFGVKSLFTYIRDTLSGAERKAKIKARRDARQKARLDRLEQKDIGNQLKTLSCTASGQPMTVNRLINRRRTDPVVVWNKTKDMVCRPFQQH